MKKMHLQNSKVRMEDFENVMHKLLQMMSLIKQERDMLDEVVPLRWVMGRRSCCLNRDFAFGKFFLV